MISLRGLGGQNDISLCTSILHWCANQPEFSGKGRINKDNEWGGQAPSSQNVGSLLRTPPPEKWIPNLTICYISFNVSLSISHCSSTLRLTEFVLLLGPHVRPSLVRPRWSWWLGYLPPRSRIHFRTGMGVSFCWRGYGQDGQLDVERSLGKRWLVSSTNCIQSFSSIFSPRIYNNHCC